MDFTVEQRAFPSDVHRRIYWAARQMAPPDVSLAGLFGAQRDAFAAYGAFVMDMLADMYADPGAYRMPTGELGELDIRVNATCPWDDPELINARLRQQSPAFQQYVLRHIWGCTACSTSHLGRFATILGRRRRVCAGGGIGFRWANPGAEDLAAIESLLAMRCQIIDRTEVV